MVEMPALYVVGQAWRIPGMKVQQLEMKMFGRSQTTDPIEGQSLSSTGDQYDEAR
jgi:hypothetical protein